MTFYMNGEFSAWVQTCRTIDELRLGLESIQKTYNSKWVEDCLRKVGEINNTLASNKIEESIEVA